MMSAKLPCLVHWLIPQTMLNAVRDLHSYWTIVNAPCIVHELSLQKAGKARESQGIWPESYHTDASTMIYAVQCLGQRAGNAWEPP